MLVATISYLAKTFVTTWCSLAIACAIAFLTRPVFGNMLLFVTLPIAVVFVVVMDRRYDKTRPFVELPK
jgi:4-amino-4-deoxy-L-arabinose transferase-like glycosyltransferase